MPRISLRKQVINELEKLVKKRRIDATIRSLISEDVSMDSDEGDDADDEQDDFAAYKIVDKAVESTLQSILSRRYLFKRNHIGKVF
jgi:hypothetical protein